MANGFVGQVHIDNNDYLIGSTLFATSSSLAAAETKTATLQGSAPYTGPVTGITVHVLFANANSVTDSTKLKLQLGTDSAYPINNPNGALTWASGSVISFTLTGTTANDYAWIMNSSAIDASSVQNLSLGQITNQGTLATASTIVVTNSNKEITNGAAFSSTADGTFLDNTGNWSSPVGTLYGLAVGANNSATANAAVTASTNSIFLNLIENGTVKTGNLGSHNIVGTGGVTVASDSNGKITINGKEGTVTSITLQTTAPLNGGSSTATTTTGTYTLSLADGYGDTKNPYGTKTAHYVLAGPTSGNAAAPTFRALVTDDIPNTIARLASPAFTGTPTAPTVADATDSSTNIATTAFVAAAINSKLASNDAMLFKGTIGTGGTVTTLPTTHNAGDTYRVITAGTYAGQQCEVGDLIICVKDVTNAANAADSDWTVAQTNIDGSVYMGDNSLTSGQLLIADGSNGKIGSSGYTLAAPTAAGDILYATSTTAYGVLAKGTSNQVLTINSSTGLPTWENAQHFTTHLYVTTSSGTGNTTSQLTNGNVYLRLFDTSTVRETHKISGAGGATVTTDASANIIITSKKYKASSRSSALTGISLKYTTNQQQTETVTSGTAVALGYVNNGILYIKSIDYSTSQFAVDVGEDTST